MVHDGYIFVSYSTNKDDAQFTRVPISNLKSGLTSVSVNELMRLDGNRIIFNDASSGEVEVYDIAGITLLKKAGTVISLADLPSGIYILKATSGGKTMTRKLAL